MKAIKNIIKKKLKRGKKKEYNTTISFQCDGKYLTHKWNGTVNLNVSEELLSRVCVRCGRKYAELYEDRKRKALEKYRASVGKSAE